MLPRWTRAVAVMVALLPAAWANAQVVAGQVDTFEDGTTQNWSAGPVSPAPPTNVSTGGPAGTDDNFLQILSFGGPGRGSRLTAFNRAQWAGDYTGAGVTGIEMDVINLGQTDLVLRLAFSNPTVGPPTDAALTAAAPTLVAGSGWTHLAFAVTPADLIALLGDPLALMGNVTELRVMHGPTESLPPDPIAGMLGIDNVRATAGQTAPVPEPAGASAATALLLALGAWRGRARRPGRLRHSR